MFINALANILGTLSMRMWIDSGLTHHDGDDVRLQVLLGDGDDLPSKDGQHQRTMAEGFSMRSTAYWIGMEKDYYFWLNDCHEPLYLIPMMGL